MADSRRSEFKELLDKIEMAERWLELAKPGTKEEADALRQLDELEYQRKLFEGEGN